MVLDWSIFGLVVLGTAINSAAGLVDGMRQQGEKLSWKRLGASLVQALVLGVVAGFAGFSPELSLLTGWGGAKTLDKVGLNFRE